MYPEYTEIVYKTCAQYSGNTCMHLVRLNSGVKPVFFRELYVYQIDC